MNMTSRLLLQVCLKLHAMESILLTHILVSIRRVKKRIFQLAEKTNDWTQAGLRGRVAHDHSSKLIAADKLPQPLQIRVPFEDEDAPPPQQQQQAKKGKKPKVPREYILTIEFIQDIETQSLLKYVLSSYLPNSEWCKLPEASKYTYRRGPSVLSLRLPHMLRLLCGPFLPRSFRLHLV